jgi:hypothetical protein
MLVRGRLTAHEGTLLNMRLNASPKTIAQVAKSKWDVKDTKQKGEKDVQ